MGNQGHDELRPGEPPSGEVTRLLAEARSDPGARDEVFSLVMDELRAIARGRVAGEHSGGTVYPTALVNDVFLKLARNDRLEFRNRKELFGVFAIEMRRVLIDAARARRRRGKTVSDVTEIAAAPKALDAAELDELLPGLKEAMPRAAEAVELHFFAGLPTAVVAETLGVDARTVRRDLNDARGWLRERVEEE
jgi:RNA polymerase sigma factor (TIGR02999 family)